MSMNETRAAGSEDRSLGTAASWVRFATDALRQVGLTSDRAETVAEVLVEGDLLGHSTHGLQLLAAYVQALEAGTMEKTGRPEVVADRGAAVTWDGRWLPGPWLVDEAMKLGFERIHAHPVFTVVIRRSHHIACLAAYLRRAADRGLVMLLTCSDPSVASVAPFGGCAGRYTPNPIAAGFPTDGLPVLLDVSASTTTNGMVNRLNRAGNGARLPGPWLVDGDGAVTDDPAVILGRPPGAILPLGGADLGHKGFALGLLVEALTSGLGGHGRADAETRWGASVFLQLIDPDAFAGAAPFRRETGHLAAACRGTPVAAGAPPVRLPGERALARRDRQMREGLELHDDVLASLRPLAARLSLAWPAPL